MVAGLLGLGRDLPRQAICGCAIGLFAIYVASIAWAISKGRVLAPELSDSDDSDDSGSSDSDEPRAGSTSNNARRLQAAEAEAEDREARQPLY